MSTGGGGRRGGCGESEAQEGEKRRAREEGRPEGGENLREGMMLTRGGLSPQRRGPTPRVRGVRIVAPVAGLRVLRSSPTSGYRLHSRGTVEMLSPCTCRGEGEIWRRLRVIADARDRSWAKTDGDPRRRFAARSAGRCRRDQASSVGRDQRLIALVPRRMSGGGSVSAHRRPAIAICADARRRIMAVSERRALAEGAVRGYELLARRKAKVAAVALANKIARTAWAMMMTGERYREPLAV